MTNPTKMSIKPLKWRTHIHPSVIADPTPFSYTVKKERDGTWWVWEWSTSFKSIEHASRKEAKEAAQSHYEETVNNLLE